MNKKTSANKAILDLVYTAFFTALICVCSLLSINLGVVPITLQTLAVCLAAALLGFKRGVLSVAIYILLGAAGLPVFAGFKGGIAALAGPTGGFIFGFLITAAIVGLVSDKSAARVIPTAVSMIVGVLLCYFVGVLWFVHLQKVSVSVAVMYCVIPFLIPDAVKIAAAVFLTNRLKKLLKRKKAVR